MNALYIYIYIVVTLARTVLLLIVVSMNCEQLVSKKYLSENFIFFKNKKVFIQITYFIK